MTLDVRDFYSVNYFIYIKVLQLQWMFVIFIYLIILFILKCFLEVLRAQ